MWDTIAANVASYGKDLTQDIREIVTGVEREEEESKAIAPQDEDLEAYVIDLERSLIRKKQEVDDANKKIELLEAKLKQIEQHADDLQPHTERLKSLDISEDAANTALTDAKRDIERLELDCSQLRARLANSDDFDKSSGIVAKPTESDNDELEQAAREGVASLAQVLTSEDLNGAAIDPLPGKLVKYISLVTSRLIASEVDTKALKNTLHAFLLAQNERFESQAFSLPECKLKLEGILQQRRDSLQRIARLEQTNSQLEQRVQEAETARREWQHAHTDAMNDLKTTQEMLNAARDASKADKDDSIRKLQDKLQQMQRNTLHLSEELEATTQELQETQAALAKQAETLKEEMEDSQHAIMDRNIVLERKVYELTDELARTKEAHDNERVQWTQHVQVNTSSVTEAQLFELTTRLSLLEADKNLAEQDADRLQTELANLNEVLIQFQHDRVNEEAQWRAKVQALEIAATEKQQDTSNAISLEEHKTILSALAKKEEDNERLREALERTTVQLLADNDSVDKRMVVQMMLQYHESSNKTDILEVMGRILGFTEEDKERLLSHPGRIKGIPMLGSIFGATPAPSSVDVSGKSFSDAWADFLLKDTK
ncbi:unnamed protein product [Aphanomyces euteiches]